ncbi:iron ABC transporter permease [Mycoplasmatota bacterium WC44]
MKNDLNIWKIVGYTLLLIVALPIFILLIYLFTPNSEFYKTIIENTLFSYLKNTLILGLSTAVISALLGYSLAYITTFYEFKFSKYLGLLLVLPLTIPTYIAGYTYEGMLNYTGIVQSTLRGIGINVNQSYFDILSMPGAVFMFSITLYPYVYLITRSYLSKQTASYIESSRTMGKSSFDIFKSVILPLSRPAIIAGSTLVLLETLADYAVVTYFGIPTFTNAIFKTWYGLGEHESAIKLAIISMFIVVVILVLEKVLRGRRAYFNTSNVSKQIKKIKLRGFKNFLASAFASLVFLLGFLFPVMQQIYWAVREVDMFKRVDLLSLIWQTVSVGLIASALIIIIALIIANVLRLSKPIYKKLASNIVILGYSMSGAIIALGTLIIFVFVDRNMVGLYRFFNPNSRTLLLTMSPIILIFAYIIRFLSVGFNNILSSYDKMGNKYYEASKTMGNNTTKTFFKIDLPMLKLTIINSFILVFIDIIKEVTITLKLRPFNYDTLATKVFQYATDEMIPVASYPSLVIIIICIIAMILTSLLKRGRA